MNWLTGWLKKPQEKTQEKAPAPTATLKPVVCLESDVGCVRTNNEDNGKVLFTEQPGRGLLVVVADGMGGHEKGEVASQTAVDTITGFYPKAKGTPSEALDGAFRRAHQAIRKLNGNHEGAACMGTTCTALALVDGKAWAAHIGDSRLYMVRDGGIYQLSEDMTMVMEMVRQGLLTLEQAEHHEDRNVLLHAMGTKPEFPLMLWKEPMDVRSGDSFLLCSDGLHDLVQDDEICSAVHKARPQDACRKLIQMAKDRGGYDNVTVAIVLAEEAKSQPEPSQEALKETRAVEVKS